MASKKAMYFAAATLLVAATALAGLAGYRLGQPSKFERCLLAGSSSNACAVFLTSKTELEAAGRVLNQTREVLK